MEKLETRILKIGALLPYVNNARLHTDEQVNMVAASIREFGFCNPVLIDEQNTIIAGHCRVAAATKLKIETIPTICLSHLTAAQKKAYIIADNRLAEKGASWDIELLSVEFDEFVLDGFNFELTGFSSDDFAALGIGVDGAEFPTLSAGDKQPFQQRTFTLHDEQAVIVDEAVKLALLEPNYKAGINENSNGNAIAFICEQWQQQKK